MNNHISLEDLVSFVWMTRLTPELKQFVLRVNAHLLACPDCRRELRRLQAVRAEALELRRRQRAAAALEMESKVLPLFPAHNPAEASLYAAVQVTPEVVEEREL